MSDLVLVIDDNRDAADMLTEVIRKLGHEALAAYEGREAIKQAAIHHPDMVLCDLKMPDMDGFNVASGIRRQPHGEHALLVALTGMTGEVVKRHAYAAGFDLFIIKPASIVSLQEVLDILDPVQSRPV